MRKISLLLALLVVSACLYASRIENVHVVVAGYSTIPTAAKVLINDDGTRTLVGIYNELAIIKSQRWKSVHISLRNVDSDIANPNTPKDVKRYLLNIQSQFSYYGNGNYGGKAVTFCVIKDISTYSINGTKF